ncbi:MAG TPA: 50S ribosomal protein L15 [Kofleriaceae bacterium]|nr:50S ribosomal protein L15 [Kofleriaceae bacterium]
MGTTLHTLAPNPGATRKKKRVGRGRGSGTGKTSGRGQKGQKARAGHHGARVGFEGGQMPMQRRLPKRGFKNPFRQEAFPINIATLAERFESGTVDIDRLRTAGLVPKGAKLVKILGHGELSAALTVAAHRFSASARTKIEAAGGTVEVISTKPVPQPSQEAAV